MSALSVSAPAKQLYGKFSSYQELRKKNCEDSQEEHFRKHVIIFGLAWVLEGEDGEGGSSCHMLAACTSTGEIVVWKVPVSSVEGIDFSRPIFR